VTAWARAQAAGFRHGALRLGTRRNEVTIGNGKIEQKNLAFFFVVGKARWTKKKKKRKEKKKKGALMGTPLEHTRFLHGELVAVLTGSERAEASLNTRLMAAIRATAPDVANADISSGGDNDGGAAKPKDAAAAAAAAPPAPCKKMSRGLKIMTEFLISLSDSRLLMALPPDTRELWLAFLRGVPASTADPIMQGEMKKKGRHSKKMQARFYVLSASTLAYFVQNPALPPASKAAKRETGPRGAFEVRNIAEVAGDGSANTISFKHAKRDHALRCATALEYEQWRSCLVTVVNNARELSGAISASMSRQEMNEKAVVKRESRLRSAAARGSAALGADGGSSEDENYGQDDADAEGTTESATVSATDGGGGGGGEVATSPKDDDDTSPWTDLDAEAVDDDGDDDDDDDNGGAAPAESELQDLLLAELTNRIRLRRVDTYHSSLTELMVKASVDDEPEPEKPLVADDKVEFLNVMSRACPICDFVFPVGISNVFINEHITTCTHMGRTETVAFTDEMWLGELQMPDKPAVAALPRRCPVCFKEVEGMDNDEMNAHIDACLDGGEVSGGSSVVAREKKSGKQLWAKLGTAIRVANAFSTGVHDWAERGNRGAGFRGAGGWKSVKL
jgi:hypothetical protein